MTLLLAIALLWSSTAAEAKKATPASKAAKSTSPSVAGTYEISAMEMAGGLRLTADQKYVLSLSFGAVDLMESGTWKLEKDVVILKNEKISHPPQLKSGPILPTGSSFVFATDRLISKTGQFSKPLIDPTKTPAAPASTTCEPLQENEFQIQEGSLAKVEKSVVVIHDVSGKTSYQVDRKWAEKTFKTNLVPPKLFSEIQGTLPKNVIKCKQKITSGQGRMKVYGRLVKVSEDDFTVQMGTCFDFDLGGIDPETLKAVQKSSTKVIDAEVPYSAMISVGTCLNP